MFQLIIILWYNSWVSQIKKREIDWFGTLLYSNYLPDVYSESLRHISCEYQMEIMAASPPLPPRPSNMGEPSKFHKIWKKGWGGRFLFSWEVYIPLGGNIALLILFVKFGKWFYQVGHVIFFENILVCKWHIIIFANLLRPYLNLWNLFKMWKNLF